MSFADSGRLILVSNRLPVTIKRSEPGQFSYEPSAGGLVSGLNGLLEAKPFLWFGWPGSEVLKGDIPLLQKHLKKRYSAYPVWFDKHVADLHYNGLSSACILPDHLLEQSLYFQTLSCGHSCTTE